MIEFEIDGQTVSTEPGKMLIEVADAIGIYIPRFCYHKKLSIAANCRMCLVEVEKSGKPLPACATPVTPGMKVMTRSSKAILAQRSVMEFLLINHPLDCPICDQGGECELQDLAMGYGSGTSRYNFPKRSVHDKNLGPLVSSDMTRCIQCTRCVRFGAEVAGMKELGAYNRGENLEIGTYVEKTMKSELSGNVIDLCPVGALTSKPFRFSARAFELLQHDSIAPHDCLGSHIHIHTRGQEYSPVRKVMRVVPKDCEAINEVWLADRDRYSYEALRSSDRVFAPKIKIEGQWQTVDWFTALNFVVEKMQQLLAQDNGADKIAALASPSSTTEELYVLQKLLRRLGVSHLDHRSHQMDFSDQSNTTIIPEFNLSLEDLEKCDVILLIGSHLRREQPLANNRVRKAYLQGAEVMSINPVDYDFNYDISEKIIIGEERLSNTLIQLAKALNKSLPSHIEKLNVNAAENSAKTIADKLLKGNKVAILLGEWANNHPQAAFIRSLAKWIAQETNAHFGIFSQGANSAGASLAGFIPHHGPAGKKIETLGLDAKTMFAKKLQSYWLLGIEPELDCSAPVEALAALKQAEFVICLSAFTSETMQDYAHVILPLAPFSETSGTFVNVEGRWQSFVAVTPAPQEVKPGWKIISLLGELLCPSEFIYESDLQIRDELKSLVDGVNISTNKEIYWPDSFFNRNTEAGLMRLGEWPMYRIDSLVRRSAPLQASINLDLAAISIHPQLAKQLNVQEGDLVVAVQDNSQITLPIVIDERIAKECVAIPMAMKETAGFGQAFGKIELRRVG